MFAAALALALLAGVTSLLTLLVPDIGGSREAGALSSMALLVSAGAGSPVPFGLAALAAAVFGVARERRVRRAPDGAESDQEAGQEAGQGSGQQSGGASAQERAGLHDDDDADLDLDDLPGQGGQVDTGP